MELGGTVTADIFDKLTMLAQGKSTVPVHEFPWPHDFLDDQKVGGGIAWGFGQFPLAIVFGKLALDWLREDRSESRFYDARAEVEGDVDMDEYNKMLAELSQDGNQGYFRQQ